MRTLAILVLLLSSSCALFTKRKSAALDGASVSLELAQAEVELADGFPERAAKRLIEVQELEDLDTVTRHKVELLLERAAFTWLEDLLAEGASSDELRELYDSDLPARARVSAGVAAAQRMLADGKPLEAFLMIRRIDQKFPTHHERATAGDVVAHAGFGLARSTQRRFFFFALKERASEALEYLVLTYPSNQNCEEAYLKLAALYEDQDQLDVAQDRYEELLLFYPESAFAPFSEARIPALRVRRVRGPRYDRSELQKARDEFDRWLERHPNDDLREEVDRSLVECKRLLVENDLVLASFYAQVEKDFGVRFHAERALLLAEEIADDELAARSADLLGQVVSAEEIP